MVQAEKKVGLEIGQRLAEIEVGNESCAGKCNLMIIIGRDEEHVKYLFQ